MEKLDPLSVECPRCRAPALAKCRFTWTRSGRSITLKTPHYERDFAANIVMKLKDGEDK